MRDLHRSDEIRCGTDVGDTYGGQRWVGGVMPHVVAREHETNLVIDTGRRREDLGKGSDAHAVEVEMLLSVEGRAGQRGVELSEDLDVSGIDRPPEPRRSGASRDAGNAVRSHIRCLEASVDDEDRSRWLRSSDNEAESRCQGGDEAE
ncbi:MAG: hypothetical protein QNK04_16680 [Myxococcota bacterium]|nr:hypothetical protein [Myxococcota bacterium]